MFRGAQKCVSVTSFFTSQAKVNRNFVRAFSGSGVVLHEQGSHHDHDHVHHGHQHGHSPSHSHDHLHGSETLSLLLSERTKQAEQCKRITWVGAWSNVALCGFKGAAGYFGNSSGLIADAVHSLSDLINDVIVLVALKLAHKPSDLKHPFGYGKFESLGSFLSSAFLVATGVGIGWHSLQELLHVATEEPLQATSLALSAAVASIVVKEALFWSTVRIGKKYKSNVIISNAWHHRSDSISTAVALVGIVGSMVGFPSADAIAGVAVSGLIVKMGVELTLDSIRDLVDEAILSGPEYDSIAQIVSGVEGVLSHHYLRIRRTGPFINVYLNIVVDQRLSVSEAHLIAERVRLAVFEKHLEANEVLVHVDVDKDQHHETNTRHIKLPRSSSSIRADVEKIVEQYTSSGVRGISHFKSHFFRSNITVELEVSVDPSLKVADAGVIARKIHSDILTQISDISDADIHLELLHVPKKAVSACEILQSATTK